MIVFLDEKKSSSVTNSNIQSDGIKIIKENLDPTSESALKTTLVKLLENKIFIPSNHMSGQAVDLSFRDGRRETAEMVLRKAGQSYPNSNHLHLNLN